MQVELQKLEGTKIELAIQINPEEVDRTREKLFQRLNKEVKIAGFRPGKVPREILERYIDEGEINRELTQILLQDGIRYAIKEKNLKILTYPEIKEVGEVKKGSDFKFKVEMELKPEIKLPEYKGLELEKEELEVKESHIEDTLRKLQEKYFYFEEVKDRPAQKGDFVFIEYEGKVGEIPLDKKKIAGIELGKGEFLLELEEKIEGMRQNEEKEISLILPEHYPQKEFAGKMANFKVCLKEIKLKKIPPLSEEFAKSLNFESLEDLRKKVRKDFENGIRNLERNILEKKLVDKLLKESELELPLSLVEEEKKRIFANLENQLKAENKILNDYLKEREITKEKLEEEITEDAKNRVKIGLIVEEIAEKENIKVTQKERDEVINNLAKNFGYDPVKFKEKLEREGKNISFIDYEILFKKVLDFILERANIKSRKREETNES
jgi:trigger factor